MDSTDIQYRYPKIELLQQSLQLQEVKKSADALSSTFRARAEELSQENKANEQKAQQYK